jgi:leucyl aminopeptidase (aminopeptidase T)
VGNILYDEKIAGTVHLAFGMNTSLGGKNACGAHEDVVLLKPTVLVDDRPLLERGVFVPADLKGGPARPSRSR